MTDIMDNLGADYADGWRPNEGDKVVGKITDISQGWSDQGAGSYYPIITIDDEIQGKPIAVHAFHFVLKKKLDEFSPEVGDRIGIMFKEKVPTKDGKRTVAIYDVKVEGKSPKVFNPPVTSTAPVHTQEPKHDDEDDFLADL